MVNKDNVSAAGNVSGTNKKEGGAGFDASALKASKTTVKTLSHEAAKNDAKNTFVKNNGNKTSGSVSSE